jgi:fluoride ion exporter CrcB/FEX
MLTYLYIALESAPGGIARYWYTVTAGNYFGSNFPYGTLIVRLLA